MRRASGLRCRSCEVPLPTGAARCPSCGIEQEPSMFLDPSHAPTAVTVTVPRRRRPVVVVVVAAAALAVAFVLMQPAGSSVPEAAPTAIAPAPTTTTLAQVPRERLGEPTGTSLVVTTVAGTTRFDLDSGEVKAAAGFANGNII